MLPCPLPPAKADKVYPDVSPCFDRSASRTRPLLLLPLLLLALGNSALAEPEPACWPAIDALAANLPELVAGRNSQLTWRGLPVTVECRGREIGRITVQWTAGSHGSTLDAHSAIAALGARLTGDTATAVRGALERCDAAAGKQAGTNRGTGSRSIVACTLGRDAASYTVQRRGVDD